MFEKLMLWIRGYLLCNIRGYSIERFMNLCRSKGIEIWKVNRYENGYAFFIRLKDYRKIRPIARKAKTVPYIKKRYGLPFLLHRYRRRTGLFIGVLLFVTIIYTMSLFIWDISIEGGYKYTKEVLLEFINEDEVYTGILKKKVDCQKLEEDIRLKYSDISWVSAEIRGTRLIVRFMETNMPVPKKDTREPSHIVATKPGIIQNIITRNGTPQVKIGDVVHEGDVIVSGIVDVVGDFDALIRKKLVVADADIVCKSYYNYNESFPLKHTKKVYTGKEKKGYGLSLFNTKFSLYSPRISYKNCDIMKDEVALKLSWNFYLPARCHVTTYREYYETQAVYTEEEAVSIAKNRLKEYLDVLVDNDVKIIENNVKIEVDGDTCKATGKIVVYESCWDYQQIEDNEWRDNQTDELNGVDH